MIPKIIHYCWFGNKKIPDDQIAFIQEWKRIMPDYEFRLWNEENSPMQIPYVKVAYRAKQWANVSNFVRLHAVFHEGGIYLDTDVRVIREFDELLALDCFFGFESKEQDKELVVNSAVFGAVPRHPFIHECKNYLLSQFSGLESAQHSSPVLVTSLLLKHGLTSYGRQVVNGVTLLPQEVFYPYQWHESFSDDCILKSTLAVHHWSRSWWQRPQNSGEYVDKKQKTELIRLLSIYKHYGLYGIRLYRDPVVQFGPFQGMKFISSVRKKSAIFPKLTGSSDCSLHATLYSLMDNDYKQIVVIGGGDGYYSVGLALMFPDATVLSYGSGQACLETVKKNAELNGVANRVILRNLSSPQEGLQEPDYRVRSLVLFQESYFDWALLPQETVNKLKGADLIIRLIPMYCAAKISVEGLFQSSHCASLVSQRSLPVLLVHFLKSVRHGDQLLNLLKQETSEVQWMILKSKTQHHGSVV